jgi:hypothetical protein
VIVRGTVDRPLSSLRLLTAPTHGGPADGITADLMAAMPAKARRASADGAEEFIDELGEGDVAIAAVSGWERLASLRPPTGAALVLVPDGLLPGASANAAGTEWTPLS